MRLLSPTGTHFVPIALKSNRIRPTTSHFNIPSLSPLSHASARVSLPSAHDRWGEGGRHAGVGGALALSLSSPGGTGRPAVRAALGLRRAGAAGRPAGRAALGIGFCFLYLKIAGRHFGGAW